MQTVDSVARQFIDDRGLIDSKGQGMTRVLATRRSAALAAVIAVTLVGCTPTPAPSSSASPSPKPIETVLPSASPEPEPDPVAEPLTIPGCETLLPIALARTAFADSTEFLGENVATEYYPWYQLPPVITALSGVTNARSCWWGVPNSDGSFSMLVAEIDPATRPSIEAALTAEGFSSVSMGTVTGREAEREGLYSLEAETHLFTGDVWIVADAGTLSVTGIATGSALDALRTANPTLGL